MIPGSNLLNLATTIIAKVPFSYYAFTGRSYDNAGDLAINYAAAVTKYGSVQPVARTLFEQMGLDFSRDYITIHTPNNITGIQKGTSGDYVRWNAQWWVVETQTNWYAVDGWKEIVCVRTDTAPTVPDDE